MKMLIRFSAALLAVSLMGGSASALTASQAQIANAKSAVVKTYHRGHRHHRRHGGAFRNWCAYNCYAVRPGTRPPLGAYGYSQYAYDEDLPFRYKYDWDASPTDNGLALIYPYTGEPILRIFERTY